MCTQQIELKPGNNYSAGIKVKTLNVSGDDYGASFCVEWMDKNGKWIGGAYPTGIKGTHDWTEISAVVSVPDNAEKFIFCCYVRKGMTGTAWFDDAYIRPYKKNKMNVVMLKPVYRGLLLSDGDQKIALSVNLNDSVSKGVLLSSAILDSSGKVIHSVKTLLNGNRNNYEISLDASDIENGNYTANVKLMTENGELLDSWNKSIRKISSESLPKVYFDDQKRLTADNKKVFPLGMYWGSINETDLKKYSESTFNLILPYSRPTADQMHLADEYHMKVIYSVKDYYAGTQFAPSEIKTSEDELPLLKQTIEEFKDSHALLAWYNNDEFRPEYMESLDKHYKMIESEDPDHPVLSIIIDPNQSGLYMNSTDIIGSDPYVIPNRKINLVGEAVQTIEKKTYSSQPVWMVIQAHNMGNYTEFIPNPQDYRSPTYEEMRCMSWQAICEGADGLLYYSFFDLKRNKDVPFETQWTNLKRIASEIYSYSEVLLSEEKSDSIIVKESGDSSRLDWTTRKYNNKLYIFVVNTDSSISDAEFILPAKYKSVKVSGNSADKLSLENSGFKDSLGGLELKIYKAE